MVHIHRSHREIKICQIGDEKYKENDINHVDYDNENENVNSHKNNNKDGTDDDIDDIDVWEDDNDHDKTMVLLQIIFSPELIFSP